MRKISMKRKSKSELNNSTASTNDEIENNAENGQDSSQENNNHAKKKGSKKGKKGKKSNNNFVESNGTDDNFENDEQFEVETVLDQRTVKGMKQYLIRWKGYGSESDTWEPESTLNCPELIEKFLTSQKYPAKGKKRASQGNNKKYPKKGKSTDSEEEDEEPVNKKIPKRGKYDNDENAIEGEYEVDRIIEVHHKKNGKREFLVHWKGYSAKENTWEPEENMSCPDLIEKFMAKVDKAKETNTRELRVDRKPTKHFTLSMMQSGRRLSRRNLGKQRAQYKETD